MGYEFNYYCIQYTYMGFGSGQFRKVYVHCKRILPFVNLYISTAGLYYQIQWKTEIQRQIELVYTNENTEKQTSDKNVKFLV